MRVERISRRRLPVLADAPLQPVLTKIVNLLLRSTSVPIGLALPAPLIR